MLEDKVRRRPHNQQPKDETWIYALSHPLTNEVRYIGQTCRSIDYRLSEHIRTAKSGGHWPVTRWIRKLLTNGLKPVATQIELVPPDADWRTAESRWIAHYDSQNPNRLLNATQGGEGTRGYRMSFEAREHLSNIAREQKRKPPGNKGKTFGPEYRKKLSDAHKGKPGHPWSPQHRANYEAALAANPRKKWTPELREKTMAARKAYKTTDAHRQSLSDAAKRAWQTLKVEGFKTSETERLARRVKRKQRKSEANPSG